jgi:hypothetical protein
MSAADLTGVILAFGSNLLDGLVRLDLGLHCAGSVHREGASALAGYHRSSELPYKIHVDALDRLDVLEAFKGLDCRVDKMLPRPSFRDSREAWPGPIRD